MTNVLLISEKDLKEEGIINENISFTSLKSIINFAQDEKIQNIIGTRLYNEIKTYVLTGTTSKSTGVDLIYLIDNFIFYILLYTIQAEIVVVNNFKIRQIGTKSVTDTNLTEVNISEIKYLKNYYESKSKFYEERLVEYLCFHSAKYQNYILNTNEDIQPDHTVKSNQGIVFDNDDYCEFNKIKYI